MKRLRTIALLIAAAALLAVPAIGQADHGSPHGKANGKSKGKGKGKGKAGDRCVVRKGFVVKGTLVSYTPDGAAAGNQETVTITVTGANRHARNSGDLNDSGPQNALAGTQFTVPTSDEFDVQLTDYETGEAPGTGDRVRIVGKVPVTKKKCVTNPNTTLADRYGVVNVRKVKIVDAD